jgi:hypothetical protein
MKFQQKLKWREATTHKLGGEQAVSENGKPVMGNPWGTSVAPPEGKKLIDAAEIWSRGW